MIFFSGMKMNETNETATEQFETDEFHKLYVIGFLIFSTFVGNSLILSLLVMNHQQNRISTRYGFNIKYQ